MIATSNNQIGLNFDTGAQKTGLHVVDGNVTEAGRVVFYRLSGGTTEERVKEACDAVLMRKEHRPKLPDAKAILTRTVEELRKKAADPKRCLRRPITGGYALVMETKDDKDQLSYSTGIKATINKDTKQLVISNASAGAEYAFRGEFNRQRYILSAQDFSKWLVTSLARIEAAVLRDRGGVYFVPNHQLPEWAKIVAVTNAATSHTIHEMPAMPSEKTVEAILDSLTREAQALVTVVENDIKENQASDAEKKPHGKRALRTKVQKLEQMKSKLASYDRVLGIKVPEIDKNLTDVRANVVLHALALEAEQDSRASR